MWKNRVGYQGTCRHIQTPDKVPEEMRDILYHRYFNPINWHKDICDNFARLPHPHHPAQKCWNQTQSPGPHLPALTRNRGISWHHIRLACFCNNFTSLTLSLTQDHHTTVLLSSLQSLSSCTQISHFSMPQLALLNIPICTKTAIMLASDTGSEDAFEFWSKSVHLHIYSLLCYTCNHYSHYQTLSRALLQMSFQYNKKPLWKNTILSN